MPHLALWLALALLIAPQAHAATYTARTVSEVQAALNKATAGDTIYIGPGEYRMQLNTQSDGVTIRGTETLESRFYWPGSGSGNQIVSIRNSDITMINLVFDGEKRAGEAHGLVRFYTSRNIVFKRNMVLNSRGTLISVGGSVPGAQIQDVKILGNHIEGGGTYLPGASITKYGECLYIGSNDSPEGSVKNIEVAGNSFIDCSDNAIDNKDSSKAIHIHHNLIEKQVERTSTGLHGTIVAQGSDHVIEHNIIRNVNGGSAVLNLYSRANIRVRSNVITDAIAETMVRSRGSGDSTATTVQANTWCNLSTTRYETTPTLQVTNNAGLDAPKRDCEPIIAGLMLAMTLYQGGVPSQVAPVFAPPVLRISTER